MKQYQQLIRSVLASGSDSIDRTGVGTRRMFGGMMRFDLREGLPLLTLRRIWWRGVLHELLWFLQGSQDISYLRRHGVERLWSPWADADGRVGPIYGAQWRSWMTHDGDAIDQLSDALEALRADHTSRRAVVSAWNPGEIPDMALPPCHTLFQLHVAWGRLSLSLYQRSADVVVGLPFNLASYATLTHICARILGLEVGDLIWHGGDVHIYRNHFAAAEEMLIRESRALPTLALSDSIEDLDTLSHEDFELIGYDPHPSIKCEVAV